ncbi:hypothetical protein ACUNE3_19885 [Serratia sp. IR-2025]
MPEAQKFLVLRIHLDLHRQPGIIRDLIPVGDLQRIPLQLHGRAVRAPQLQAGRTVETHHKHPTAGVKKAAEAA